MKIKGALNNTKIGNKLKKIIPGSKMVYKGGAVNHKVPASYIRDKR